MTDVPVTGDGQFLDFSQVPLPALLKHRNDLYGALTKATEARNAECIGAARRCIRTIEDVIAERNLQVA